MSQPDFGSTFETLNGDLTPSMRLLTSDIDKVRGMLASWARRLGAEPGSLWYDQNYGLCMNNFVAEDESPSVAATLINQCLTDDERCANCTTDIAVSDNGKRWVITTHPTAKDGSVYALVFHVTADKVTLFTATQGS